MNKRGLSPVIATALLIVIVLVLALIIFLWARGFLKEKNVKFNQPIENSCADIVFNSEASAGVLSVVNNGNIPIYQFEIYKIDAGSRTLIDKLGCANGATINPGDDCDMNSDKIVKGNTIFIAPIILGMVGETEQPYTCIKSGEELNVS